MIRIEEDKLIRLEPLTIDKNEIITYQGQLVITKEEFIACYNAWIKEKEE